ncbi:hypothetical protein ACE5D9_07325 [Rickettsia sp. 2024-CO-Wats]
MKFLEWEKDSIVDILFSAKFNNENRYLFLLLIRIGFSLFIKEMARSS